MSLWAQVWTIARLELSRVFFSKRSFWVYGLAFFPAVIFLGHAIDSQLRAKRWAAEASVTPAMLDSFREGMSDEQVIAAAGKPARDFTWKRRQRREEGDDDPETRRTMTYSDVKRQAQLRFSDGKLTEIRVRPILDLEEDRRIFAGVFQYFYLRLAIFFGCLGVFINLFRGEMLDRSLHYWFLAPVRREVLLLGKYLAGLIAAGLIFSLGTALSFTGMILPHDSADVQVYLGSMGYAHLGWYILAAVLGCVGYGSVFLASGLLLRNPIVPAIVILLWESANGFLPDALQKLSVLHYLQSVCPVPAPMDSGVPPLLRMLLAPAAPSSTLAAVLGLLGVTALVLFAASHAVRRLEINYGTE
ncbi:MAG: hypothetical protein FJW30_05845 [Acidobacteria bacterium]|nr:hypothetical protein [Acidobacteriota bacterium]